MSTQKQPTNCTNSTNSSISEIREISEPSPKISVIVPVYKVEKYLPECIESVLAQTFTDFELILVDDGSPDNSGAICEAYAARDPRIRVFHKENGGVSSARNLGLDNAKGEWIAFVDSDDTIGPHYLEFFLKDSERDADLILCSYTMVDTAGNQKIPSAFQKTVIEITAYGAKLALAGSGWNILQQVCVWGKLFRGKEIIKNRLRFDEKISLGEDQLFFTKFLMSARRIVAIESCEYFYLWESGRGSLTTTSLKCPREMLRLARKQEFTMGMILEKWKLSEEIYRPWMHMLVWSHYNRSLRCLYEQSFSLKGKVLLRFLYGVKGHFRAHLSTPQSMGGKAIKYLLLVSPTCISHVLFKLFTSRKKA